jgi:aldehyde dehydrogenase (NAD+)
MTEIGMSRDEIRFLLKGLPRWIRPRTVLTPLAQFAAHSFVWPEPFGNALIISPWNYPVLLSLDPLAGALAAGNTVVLKPSNYSKATSQALYDLLKELTPGKRLGWLGAARKTPDLLPNSTTSSSRAAFPWVKSCWRRRPSINGRMLEPGARAR